MLVTDADGPNGGDASPQVGAGEGHGPARPAPSRASVSGLKHRQCSYTDTGHVWPRTARTERNELRGGNDPWSPDVEKGNEVVNQCDCSASVCGHSPFSPASTSVPLGPCGKTSQRTWVRPENARNSGKLKHGVGSILVVTWAAARPVKRYPVTLHFKAMVTPYPTVLLKSTRSKTIT